MLPFLARACWRKLWTLFLISIVSFLVIHLAPGAPSQIDPMNPRFTKEQLQRYRAAFDLDKPLHVQYGLFYQRLFTGQLRSFKDNQPVLPKIVQRAWNSFPLFVVGTVLVWCFAFPLGIATAVRRDSWFDRATTVLVFALISVPGFYLSYLAIIFVVETFQVDVIGIQTFGRDPTGVWTQVMDRTWHLVLPSLLGATAGIAVLSRYVRSQMLEVLSSDYVRTARAKGLPEDEVLYRHALRNGLLPFVTMLGLLIPALIGGSVIFETIFAWPGIGRLGYEAILSRDYPVVIALNFIAALLTVVGTLAVGRPLHAGGSPDPPVSAGAAGRLARAAWPGGPSAGTARRWSGLAIVLGFFLVALVGIALTKGAHPILDPREVRLPDRLQAALRAAEQASRCPRPAGRGSASTPSAPTSWGATSSRACWRAPSCRSRWASSPSGSRWPSGSSWAGSPATTARRASAWARSAPDGRHDHHGAHRRHAVASRPSS